MIIDRAEPFFYPGSKTGCLLVHGFTGTPEEMHPLGKHLAQAGYSVLGIRLFGHATQPNDMIRARWQDWFASVEDGWHLLKCTCDQVFLLGLSMGGVLSLAFASQFPVSGLVIMATPHHMPKDPRLAFIKIISLFMPYIHKGKDIWMDQEAYQQRVCYPVDPTRAYAELQSLLTFMQAGLPRISCPTMLIYSKDDPVIRKEDNHLETIFAQIGSQVKQTLWIENSGHVITRDLQRHVVFEACTQFIEKVLN